MTDYRKHPDPKKQLAELGRGPRASRPVVTAASGGRIELVLSLPPRAATQNHQRGNWKPHVAAKRALRIEACRAMLDARQQMPDNELKPWWGAKVEVRFFAPDNRERDPTNLLEACKAFWDGFVDAGLLKKDNRLLAAVVADVKCDPANPRTELLILQREGEDGETA